MSSTVVLSARVLNPAAKEFVPTRSASLTSIGGVSEAAGPPRRSQSGPVLGSSPTGTKRGSRRQAECVEEAGESRSVSPRGPSSLASSTSGSETTTKQARSSFKGIQQLKVHAPGCDCQRLRRTREELGDDSGFLVTSRDARAPDVHFGAAYGFFAGVEVDDAGRRDREARLAEAIASSDVPGQRISCAACLLDGHWRNGAVCLVGDARQVDDLCRSSNQGKDHKHLLFDADIPPLDVVLGTAPGDDDDDDAAAAPAGGRLSAVPAGEGQLVLVRCVAIKIATLRAVLQSDPPIVSLPFINGDRVEERRAIVDVKHHVLEALDILSLDDDKTALCLTYVDNRGVVSLDFPGGKRRLAETAWQAAARETAAECGLDTLCLGDAFHGEGGRLRTVAQETLAVTDSVDGQSVRFFLLAFDDDDGDDAEHDKNPEDEVKTPEEDDPEEDDPEEDSKTDD